MSGGINRNMHWKRKKRKGLKGKEWEKEGNIME